MWYTVYIIGFCIFTRLRPSRFPLWILHCIKIRNIKKNRSKTSSSWFIFIILSVLCPCALLSFTCSLMLPYKHCYTQRRFRSYLRFHSNLHRKTAHNVECCCWSRSVGSRPCTDQPPLATDSGRSDVLELDGYKINNPM